uniref:J domain-containing protein n=1 Tax=Vitis vinifera TaxID=29760 RepID=F6I113_VITVI
MASSSSLYEVLGIPVSASGNEIKAAYRRLARVCHPDVVAMNQKETSANEFMKIHAAYSTLSDPDKRANYDQDLFRRRRPVMATAMRTGGSSFSGFSRRTWETDQCWNRCMKINKKEYTDPFKLLLNGKNDWFLFVKIKPIVQMPKPDPSPT